MTITLVQSANGSVALYDAETGETMHPNGPALEAERVYIGPSRLRERSAVVFDVGMGGGTNALAALHAGASRVVSFERTLEPIELALANAEAFDMDVAAVKAMLAGTHPKWELRLGDVPDTLRGQADVVFWDMYSPQSQPELWSADTFRKLRACCHADTTVHTYSGATSTRAALLSAGFYVGFGPSLGAKQKRSTIASLSLQHVAEPLAPSWLRDARTEHRDALSSHPQFRTI